MKEEFKCPYCCKTIYIHKLKIVVYYLLNKEMKMMCKECKNNWIVNLMLKRVYWFKPTVEDYKIYNQP